MEEIAVTCFWFVSLVCATAKMVMATVKWYGWLYLACATATRVQWQRESVVSWLLVQWLLWWRCGWAYIACATATRRWCQHEFACLHVGFDGGIVDDGALVLLAFLCLLALQQ
jgi:hypothetical protein